MNPLTLSFLCVESAMTAGGIRFEIMTEDGTFEIIAESATIQMGKVYHYDRGVQLQPGERIAPWVKDVKRT